MSTVQRVNFEPNSDILAIQTRDFPLADRALADPLNAVALVDGEWMIQNASHKAVRATNIGSVGAVAAGRSWPLWAERGRTDVQASGKVPLIWIGSWEFDTRIYDMTATPDNGVAITAIDQPLKVATITLGGRNYTGLVGHGGSGDASVVVGFVTRLPANNGGKLKLRGGLY